MFPNLKAFAKKVYKVLADFGAANFDIVLRCIVQDTVHNEDHSCLPHHHAMKIFLKDHKYLRSSSNR